MIAPRTIVQEVYVACRASGARQGRMCRVKQIARLMVAAVFVAWATESAHAAITPSYEDGGKTMEVVVIVR